MNKNTLARKRLFMAVGAAVYVLLLFQQVMLNPVWCYKPDGSVNLELALGKFRCDCQADNHQHDVKARANSRFCAESGCCIDRPAADSRLYREVTSPVAGFKILKLYLSYEGKRISLNDFDIDLPGFIPPGKFPGPSSFQCIKQRLRC